MTRCLLIVFGALLASGPGFAAAPREDRTSGQNVPLFSRHVAAVFSRLGCNGGTCHGAVQGRRTAFACRCSAPTRPRPRAAAARVRRPASQPADPDASLLLLKATGQVSHGGGKRMDVGSPEYEILRRWIAGGASLMPSTIPRHSAACHPGRADRQPRASRIGCASRPRSPTVPSRTLPSLLVTNRWTARSPTVDRDGQVQAGASATRP